MNQLAYCHYMLGRFPEAIEQYSKVRSIDSTNEEATQQLGKIYSAQGRDGKAVLMYGQLVSSDSLNSFYWRQYARKQMDMGAIENAMSSYEKCLDLNSADQIATSELSSLYLDLQIYQLADSLIQQGMQNDSQNLDLIRLGCRSAYMQKDYELLLDLLASVPELSGDTGIYEMKMMGIAHFHLGHYGTSVSYLEPIVEEVQDKEAILFYLGMCYREIGHYPMSESYYDKAIAAGITDNLDSYLEHLAFVQFKQLYYEDAIVNYKKAYSMNSKPVILYHLARCYDEMYFAERG